MNDLYIDTPEELENLCRQLRQHDWMTVDTEFIREKTYSPRLCLLQVANPDVVACIDPLALPSLDPLLDVLFDAGITKVFHAAFQDLEIFHEMRGAVPAPLFDTQIAATILGHGEQIGYAALVKQELGVELDKAHTRTDWCQRPLDEAQLNYAADDVRYLCDIYLAQRDKLTRLGRMDWLQEDFADLANEKRYQNPPEEAWRRIKGAGRLRGLALTQLRELAAWREREAQQSNRPRRWIMKDEVLQDLARFMPDTLEKAKRIRGLEEGTLKRHGQTLLSLIEQTRNIPKNEWLVIDEGPRLPEEQEPLVDALMAILRQCCQQNQISPAAVANRRDLEKLIMGDESSPLLHGWRAVIAGQAMTAFLRGSATLQMQDGQLKVNRDRDSG